ncbi:MAG TPA: MFS transporter [Dehalococcoidia bacterium]|nr:MFS transporter [Dehalococcoidia bacterium]
MRRSQLIAFLGCSFSFGIFSAFNSYTLTLWLAGFTSSYILLSLLGNTRSFEGTLVAPVAGYWSDKVWLPWLGRRRPFILIGGLLSALLLALTPAAAALPLPQMLGWLPSSVRGLAMAVLAIFLFTLTFNAMNDIHDALLVDITGESERNRIAALRVVVNTAGQVGILVLGFFIWRSNVPNSAFLVTGLLMAAGIITTVLFVHEPSPAVWALERGAVVEADRLTLRRAVNHYRGAALFCLVAFFYWTGLNAITPLLSIYVKDILHATVGQSQLLPAMLLVSTTLFALPMAWLGNRYGKRLVMGFGYLVVAAAGIAGLVITTKEQAAIVFALTGIGVAASQVLTIPLLADLVPRRNIGAATGILAGSGSVAAPVASLLAGGLADRFGPRIIFLFMSACVAIAFGLLPFVRRPASKGNEPDADLIDGVKESQPGAPPEL